MKRFCKQPVCFALGRLVGPHNTLQITGIGILLMGSAEQKAGELSSLCPALPRAAWSPESASNFSPSAFPHVLTSVSQPLRPLFLSPCNLSPFYSAARDNMWGRLSLSRTNRPPAPSALWSPGPAPQRRGFRGWQLPLAKGQTDRGTEWVMG